MNTNQLKLKLEKKDKSICADSKIGYVTLPLFLIYQKLFNAIEHLLHTDYNLTSSELDVLASLHDSKEDEYTLTPTKLYERLFFSSGGMTKVLKKLEQKEFINRIDNVEDKRSKLVQLTLSGKKIIEESISDIIELEEKMFAHINEEDRESLSGLLFKSLEGMED